VFVAVRRAGLSVCRTVTDAVGPLAGDWGSRGRGFESRRPDQQNHTHRARAAEVGQQHRTARRDDVAGRPASGRAEIGLVAAEELVDRSVGPDVEATAEVFAEGRTVRAGPVNVERARAIHRLAVVVKPCPDREFAGTTRQTGVPLGHGDEGARLGECGVYAAIIEGGYVTDRVGVNRDGVFRSAFVAGNGDLTTKVSTTFS